MVSVWGEDKARDLQRQPQPTALLSSAGLASGESEHQLGLRLQELLIPQGSPQTPSGTEGLSGVWSPHQPVLTLASLAFLPPVGFQSRVSSTGGTGSSIWTPASLPFFLSVSHFQLLCPVTPHALPPPTAGARRNLGAEISGPCSALPLNPSVGRSLLARVLGARPAFWSYSSLPGPALFPRGCGSTWEPPLSSLWMCAFGTSHRPVLQTEHALGRGVGCA